MDDPEPRLRVYSEQQTASSPNKMMMPPWLLYTFDSNNEWIHDPWHFGTILPYPFNTSIVPTPKFHRNVF